MKEQTRDAARYYGGDSGIPEHLRKPLYDEWTEYRDSITDPDEICPQIEDFRVGFVRGAASVSRREVVEAAFARVKEILPSISLGDFEEDDYPKAMDAVLAELENTDGK